MKRLLAALTLTAFCAVGLASYASAGLIWKIDRNPVGFYHSANNPAGKTDVDSAFACGTSKWIDTTVTIPLTETMQGMALLSAATSAKDSIPYFGVYLSPAPGSVNTIGFDSVYVGLQVSLDGANWVTVTQTQTFLAATTIPPIASACLLELASSNTVGIVWKESIANTVNTVSSVFQDATAPTNTQLFGFPYARLILTHFDTTGCMQLRFAHWANEPDYTPDK